ncbi:hypothetical protein DENSPDRAFT_71620 [Dentipellis sp. KUC8613]|nr:hypothetical protein DENSPDRAFT_71620 [Dentipellis sp. KUC8613]
MLVSSSMTTCLFVMLALADAVSKIDRFVAVDGFPRTRLTAACRHGIQDITGPENGSSVLALSIFVPSADISFVSSPDHDAHHANESLISSFANSCMIMSEVHELYAHWLMTPSTPLSRGNITILAQLTHIYEDRLFASFPLVGSTCTWYNSRYQRIESDPS